MAQRFYEPIARIFTNAGLVGVGYKYYFYQTGTTTPVTTYQNAGLTVANTNPVISDANGRFPEIWYSDLSQLKLIVKDSFDNTIETVDPVGSSASAVSLNDFDVRPTSYWGLTAGTATAFTLVANPTISAYANTQTFVVQPHLDCGDNPTLAIDGLSALNWKKYTQQGTKVALKANDLRASQRYFCINDGVDIVCLNPSSLPILSGSATALTIATGVVTLTNNSSSYVIDTEGAAATDDLNTINGGQNGQVIWLNTANNSRDVTITSGVGNIVNSTGLSIVLGNVNDVICLKYNGTNWIVQYFNYSDADPIRLISTATASSSASISFTGLNSAYSRYEIIIEDLLPVNSDVGLIGRVSIDNGATYITGASYVSSSVYHNPSTNWVSATGATSGVGIFTRNVGLSGLSNTSTKGFSGKIIIHNPSNTATHKKIEANGCFDNAAGDFSQFESAGAYEGGTSAVNAFQILLESGNIASGSFKLYGIK
jgi:hypothetical protein